MYTHLLFDLDGTLTESAPGITNSVAFALGKFGIEVRDRAELLPYVGPPLVPAFEALHGLSHEQALQALAYYREYFTAGGMFENSVYEGIEPLLQALKARGRTLCVATGKPQPFAEKILRHYGLTDYFAEISGATMDETRTSKEAVIRWCLKEQGVRDYAGAVMIGDRREDVLGAHACGLPCIGVLWGYGGRRELTEAGADALAESPAALLELV